MELVIAFIDVVAVSLFRNRQRIKENCHTSILLGEPYFLKLLNGHNSPFQESMGMDKTTFNRILELLQGGELRASSAI